MDIEVDEVVPGDIEALIAGRRHRFLVPAGVGVPGLDEVELIRALVPELLERGVVIPDVVDVTTLLRSDPQLLDAIAARADLEE